MIDTSSSAQHQPDGVGTIAAPEPLLHMVQVACPLAWRMMATLPRGLVPGDLQALRENLSRPHWHHEYARETQRLAGAMAAMPAYHAGAGAAAAPLWLDALAEALHEDPELRGKACAVFYLAAAHNTSTSTPQVSAEALLGWIMPARTPRPPQPLVSSTQALTHVRREIALALRGGQAAGEATRLSAVASLRRVALACVRHDVGNRAAVCMKDLLWHLPSYTRGAMRSLTVVLLGHYSRAWVEAFRREMRIGDERAGRARDLVRGDVSIFAVALVTLPAQRILGSEYVQAFSRRFRAEMGRGHHEHESDLALARKALAFLYRHPTQAWRAMGWPCSPREGRALKAMARDAVSPSPRAAAGLCLSLVL